MTCTECGTEFSNQEISEDVTNRTLLEILVYRCSQNQHLLAETMQQLGKVQAIFEKNAKLDELHKPTVLYKFENGKLTWK